MTASGIRDVLIPGFGRLRLEHLVLDFNGTLARDGVLLEGVAQALHDLSRSLAIHVLTADSFGTARSALAGLPCAVSVLSGERQDEAKRQYIDRLGPERTVCIGNGRNDRYMLADAALGIVVIGEEGAAIEALLAAKVACPSIQSALALLQQPLRLVATLRA